MFHCKGVDTPLAVNLKHPQTTGLSSKASSPQAFPYANILGSLHYLVTCTRPDLCFATNYLSRFIKEPQAIHVQYIKRLLRYLRATSHLGFSFSPSPPSPSLIGYSDADWGGDPTSLQSTPGYLYLLAGASYLAEQETRLSVSILH
ncbi:hypothetical protein KP509_36G053500 [Ceratopteris richardii]|uniref:Mitochondrial protein n=1 Tax=Ceratopteris richardii TaxID=49495 RepID=A0A8T2QCZ8_CERRI|nr:hypothetical protein KP509_36G053500 [Ceratopteris richardii]